MGYIFNSASSCLTLFEIQICFNGLHLSVSFVSCKGHVGLETIPGYIHQLVIVSVDLLQIHLILLAMLDKRHVFTIQQEDIQP